MNIIVKQSEKQALDLNILKQHLRIEHEHEDNYLKEVISMATDILEKNIEKPILVKTYRYTFHNDEYVSTKRIPLPVSHVNSIVSVQKVVSNDLRENISFAIEYMRDKAYIITNGTTFPIEITYTAGITNTVEEIPKDLQFAILQIAKNIYECSEEDILESKYIKRIINSNRALYIN